MHSVAYFAWQKHFCFDYLVFCDNMANRGINVCTNFFVEMPHLVESQ